MSSIHIYWDESHFWGLLAARALEAWGIPHRLVRGSEIADGVLAGKCGEAPRLLIVPGGRAKGKADRLGVRGMDAICEFVHDGGAYLGFCGGAGLALTGPYGLGLSPWTRKGYTNRLHHFLSGHVHVSLNQTDPLVPPDLIREGTGESADKGPMLPVWWPGRFDPVDASVTVLARYGRPGPDFWVADLNLSTLPQGTMADWENLYGIHLDPDFMEGTPCVTANDFGAGRVILSYAHLETPASPHANRWLAHILDHVLGGDHGQSCGPVPAWDVAARPVVWDDPALMAARRAMEATIATGTSHFLLFWRTPWLLGWRRGIPGAGINTLYSFICEAMAHEPDNATLAYWRGQAAGFGTLVGLLASGLSGYLLAERLSMTMFHSASDAVSVHGLREQRRALFGLPPEPGGIYADLAATLEELCWRLSRPGQDRT
ncbi:MAG: biotin--protein ligase [Pseudodesulfovibrio sp.]|uniref:Biotin-protein ligase-like protein n=1 Tax=Pseudodesulfovibrio aespoeensis (strain ATCC 700646 / DSM 10631 / Aspo-2) TaxID=643562 RepID=E6VQN3_PSEA9|nr:MULTISPECIES: BPL-N domain-containing protein [Pseudodesulfovibrio]MBU4190761.1 biotin--protein ligase [Pseudomonadota bacterium]ADU61760.1 Biotin-protein ligase-like protein [Pseudodesulfovibrio aespoeensis Aspo-2]MBU4242817.1 biotin--protein ligase [Pseudomonadota bacterium]MBU4378276.1 biotin--protein ligase [Pseudomonadota bacterium]MBU4475820.1 biotin--protein ligase [Pseudomonadota bacterium]